MSNNIRIKRRLPNSPLGNSLPSLSSGELAFNEINRTLYYGASSYSGISPIPIGGDGSFTTYTYIQSITSTFANSSALNALSAEVKNLSTDVKIISAEVKSLSAEVDNKFLLKSGGKITGNLTIYGDLSATGTSYFANTIYTTTSALSIINLNNTGPALYVGNNGTGDLASFYDLDTNTEVFHIGGANGSFPNVGVKTSTPNKDFTVNGEISASGNIWTSGNFISAGKELLSIIYPDINLGISSNTAVRSNSANWNSVYSSVNSVSANWNSVYTSTRDTSANWNSVYNTVNPLSSNWNSVYTSTRDVSGNWNSVYNTVNPLSSNWNSVYNTVNPLSSNWNSVYSNVQSNSANAISVYNTVNPLSSNWNSVYSSTRDVSGNWNSVYTSTRDVSGNWNSVYNTVNPLSSNWNSVYSSVNAASANWNSVYTSVSSNSALYATYNYVNSNFLNLTGGIVNGSVSVLSSFEVGVGSAVLFASGGRIGINTELPNVELTVNGSISASGNIWTSGDFISAGKELMSIIYPDINSGISSYTTVRSNSANWNASYTNLVSNSAAYLSGSDLSFLSVSGNWNSVYSSVNATSANWNSAYTSTRDTSANWNSVYNTVNPLSGSWNSVYTSTNNTSGNWNSVYSSVNATSGNWNSVYNTVNPLSGNWNSVYNTVNPLSGNWNSVYTNVNVNSGSYATINYADSKFFPISGGNITGPTKIQGNLTVYGDLSATGNSYFFNTVYSTTSALSVVNIGNTGPALYVGNNGTGDIASFYDIDSNIEVFHIGGANGTFPNVGVKTSTPNKDFTVNGEISASNTIYDISGNSNQWNIAYNIVNLNSDNWQNTYSTVNSNSATTWNYQGTDLKSLSSDWVGGNAAYTNLIANSAAYLSSVDLSFLSVSANWDSVYSTVQSNSATTWNYQGTDLKDLSANWVGGNIAFTNLISNSAAYLSGVDLSFLSVSGNWDSVYSSVNSVSSNWDSVYSSVNSVSSNWDSVYNTVNPLSSNWNSVYTSTNNTSGSWDSVYTNVNSNSATYATYNYVDTNFLNLTGGVINGSVSVLSSFEVGGENAILYVSGGKIGINTELPNVELTVNGSISASNKIYGTIIDWMTLVRGYKTTPTLLQTIAGGDVYTYVYSTTGTDITYYRYIANDNSEDSFYRNFTSGTLSNLIARKAIIL